MQTPPGAQLLAQTRKSPARASRSLGKQERKNERQERHAKERGKQRGHAPAQFISQSGPRHESISLTRFCTAEYRLPSFCLRVSLLP